MDPHQLPRCVGFSPCNCIFTLQGINISHLGKRKVIFKMPFLGDMLVPWRVVHLPITIKHGWQVPITHFTSLLDHYYLYRLELLRRTYYVCGIYMYPTSVHIYPPRFNFYGKPLSFFWKSWSPWAAEPHLHCYLLDRCDCHVRKDGFHGFGIGIAIKTRMRTLKPRVETPEAENSTRGCGAWNTCWKQKFLWGNFPGAISYFTLVISELYSHV